MSELYDMGYAIPLYGMYSFTWRHRNEEITLPHEALRPVEIDGIPCAKWSDVIALTSRCVPA